MPSISGVIVAYNEADDIGRAVASLDAADEVIVVDSGSTDDTRKVAEQAGARVIGHAWEGYVRQKNFAAAQAAGDWILSLDADEELNGEARAAIRRWKNSEPDAAGYRFTRRAKYLGRWIAHSGWYPDWKVRLFDRRRARWSGGAVHESVEVEGNVATLAGEILHYTFESLEDHRQRIEFYTDLAAREMIERHDGKNRIEEWLLPPWTFFQTYFLKLGIFDGRQGFLIARMAAHYVRRKYAKLRLLQGGSRG